jgi:hypothetical protein
VTSIDLEAQGAFRARAEARRLSGMALGDFAPRLVWGLDAPSFLVLGGRDGGPLRGVACPTVLVDVQFAPVDLDTLLNGRARTTLVRKDTAAFFAEGDAKALLPDGAGVTLIDQTNVFEGALRDFAAAEAHAAPGGVILVTGCFPATPRQAMRVRTVARAGDEPEDMGGLWLGDLWKLVAVLASRRPDLRLRWADVPPGGLLIVDQLDPANRALTEEYDAIVAAFLRFSVDEAAIDRMRASIPMIDSTTVEWATREDWARVFAPPEAVSAEPG